MRRPILGASQVHVHIPVMAAHPCAPGIRPTCYCRPQTETESLDVRGTAALPLSPPHPLRATTFSVVFRKPFSHNSGEWANLYPPAPFSSHP